MFLFSGVLQCILTLTQSGILERDGQINWLSESILLLSDILPLFKNILQSISPCVLTIISTSLVAGQVPAYFKNG